MLPPLRENPVFRGKLGSGKISSRIARTVPDLAEACGHDRAVAICRELTDLNAAFFDRNASTLTDEARAALQDNVDILNECPNICVSIEGHAAPGERNAQSLSTARANAVQKFYTDNGVAASRLTAMGKGRVEGVSRKEGTSQYRRADSIPGACMMGDM